MENKQTIEPELIRQLAKALNVSGESIENLTDEMVANFFHSNNFYDSSASHATFNERCNLTFNPLDKLIEIVGKNEALYEQLLKVEREKMLCLKDF